MAGLLYIEQMIEYMEISIARLWIQFSPLKNYETASVEIGGRLKKNKHVKYYTSEYAKNILFTHGIRMLKGFYS